MINDMWFGPIAILITWIAYAIVYFKTERSGHVTLSGIAASSTLGYWVFCIGLLMGGVFTFVFTAGWFMNALQLPNLYLVLTGIAALVFQPIIAMVPYRGVRKGAIHNFAAYVEMAMLPLLSALIAQSPVLPGFVQLICWAIVLFMIYLLFEFRKYFLNPRFIIIQALYVGSFHLAVLIATATASLRN